jgi:hypothetical protein
LSWHAKIAYRPFPFCSGAAFTLLVHILLIFGSVSEAGSVRETSTNPGFFVARANALQAPAGRENIFLNP